jgi:hypothetical protein
MNAIVGERPKSIVLSPVFAVFLLGASLFFSLAEASGSKGLNASARKVLPERISTEEIAKAFQSALWNSDKTAVAISLAGGQKESLVYVFIRQKDGAFLAVNASDVELGNIGKLGMAKRDGYSRIETKPVKWLIGNNGLLRIELNTKAWKDGKRYSVTEPLIIKPNGSVLWR